jgi:hypothetical protein
MAKKYQELVRKYSTEIARIKAMQAKVDEAKRKVNEFEASANWDNYDHDAFEDLARDWETKSVDLHIEYEKLSQDIEAEYWDVPFASPRKQGIQKFFEEAGI